jgi:hypothetical protein
LDAAFEACTEALDALGGASMPRTPTGSILPGGESLRRAVQWISDRRQDTPDVPLHKLVDEASVRFDLSPMEAQFLLQNWSRVQDQDDDADA